MRQLIVRPLPEPDTFALLGELDMASADEVLSSLSGVSTHRDLVLDLRELTFMDSSGLRVILQLAQARDGDACIVLRNPCPPVARVLEIALPGDTPGVRIERNVSLHG